MTKDEVAKLLADIPDYELLFVVRGTHPAAPETLREYARRVLHYQRISGYPETIEGAEIAAKAQAQARAEANDAFTMADMMEQTHDVHVKRMADERRVGLTANDENEKLEAEERERTAAVVTAETGSQA